MSRPDPFLSFISFLSGVVLFYSFQYFLFSTTLIILLSSVYLSVQRRFITILIVLVGIAFAFFRYETGKDMSQIWGKEALVRGVVKSYPMDTERGIFKQEFHIESAGDGKTGEKLNELVNQDIFILSEREFTIGTACDMRIQFLKDRSRLNPGTWVNDGLYANLIEIIDSGGKRISLYSTIQEYRYKLNRYIGEHFKKDSGAFLASITTGQRASMDEKLRDAFNAVGLAHILSISGTHFGLFSVFLFGVFTFLIKAIPYKVLQRITIFCTPSQAAAILCLPFMLAYLCLSGGSIPAVRSFIMIGLFLIGLVIGRKGFWLNSLLFAAFVLTLWNPNVLFDLSSQLSFLAVLFIGFSIEGKDKDNDKTDKEDDKPFLRYLKNALLMTLSASIGTAPLVAYHFHYFSIISPLTNLLIAPLIGFILIPLSVVSSFLFLITGHFVFTPIVSVISDVSIWLVRLFSNVPLAAIKIPAFPPIIVLLFYAGFIFYFLSRENTFSPSPSPPPLEGGGWGRGNLHSSLYQLIWRNFSLRKRYTLIIPFVPIIIYLSLSIFERNELNITYLDVGQGDSSVVELPDGKTIVIDTGRTGKETASFLQYKGEQVVDSIILSHNHPDHAGGLEYMVQRFHVREIWDNGKLIYPATLIDTVKHKALQRGDLIEGKGYRMYVLHPYPEFYTMHGNEYVGANNNSLVVRIEAKHASFIFPGDIEEEAEEDIIHLDRWLKSDVIKVPHHGGKTSANNPFFDTVSPEIAVISAGRDNTFGHPHQETLNALQGVKIFRTDTDGAIHIRETDKGLKIKTWKDCQFKKATLFRDDIMNIKRLFETW